MRRSTYVMGALGVGVALGAAHGAGAQVPQSATVFAMDQPFRYQVFGAPDGTTDVTIAAGGSVSFGYQEGDGKSRHNVHFTDAQPTSCVRFDSSDSVPPLPSSPRPANWSGGCTFDTPGTYAYLCDAHPNVMHGTVTVVASDAAPGPTPTPPAASPPSPGTTPPASPSPSPPASAPAPAPSSTPAPPAGVTSPPAYGPLPPAGGTPSAPAPAAPLAAAASGVRLTALPRTARVRGSVHVARAGSHLSVALRVRRSALGRRGAGLVVVGHLARANVRAGRSRFTVRVNPAARRALTRRGRLAVTVRVVVAPTSGSPSTTTRRLTLRTTRG